MKQSIKELDLEGLGAILAELKQPKYRARQLHEWLHVHRVRSYGEMTNLPLSLRSQLAELYPLDNARIVDKAVSSDGTRKLIVEYADDGCVETVGMPSFDEQGNLVRLTACLSTQIGCPMACVFCATGHEGFTRNLTAAEIVEQLALLQDDFGCRVSNVVVMGQGEPFLNYEELVKSLRMINGEDGFNIAARKITVSTCGIIEGIDSFSKLPEQFTLALSLHSAIQETRDELLPKMKGQPLPLLREALLRYIRKTNRRVTLEYLLIKDRTDDEASLRALKEFCKGMLCHVNLLTLNKVEGSAYSSPRRAVFTRWQEELSKAGIETTLRASRGSDVAGACGQLKNKHFNTAL